jgi:protein O-mannosyl-transferase
VSKLHLSDPGRRALGALALCALVALVYAQVGGFGFVAYDDGLYVAGNPMVQRGLTLDGVAWAFTTLTASNWHPLTWLSLMADVSAFGVDAGWLHRMNVAWHLANALLLWAVLERCTGARWRSWLVAVLFAVHPLHVESVAWISERKDVLSTFFWILAMGAWRLYVERPTPRRYAAVAALLVLGLLSKPMAVTFPAVLLLLDFWPFGRLGDGPGRAARLRDLVLEKVPLLAIVVASSTVTVVAQHLGGATASAEGVPYAGRLGNAVLSIASYLQRTVWPAGLAAFYPNPAIDPAGLPAGRLAAASLLLAALSAVAFWQRRRRPYLLFGWLWFGVTLLPVIGLVQVGQQGMADRYTYVPLVGVFVALVWLVPEAWLAPRARGVALAGATLAATVALAGVARAQTAHWRDTFALFDHAARVTEGNWLAWKNLGTVHHERGETQLALDAFERSARARPDQADIWFNLGVEHAALDRYREAAECFRRATLLEPADRETWFALGISRAMLGQAGGAAEATERLRAIDPPKARELETIVERISRQLAGQR